MTDQTTTTCADPECGVTDDDQILHERLDGAGESFCVEHCPTCIEEMEADEADGLR